jgi:ankyrin repeat protein
MIRWPTAVEGFMPERLSLSHPIEPAGPADALLEATLPAATAHRDGDAARALRWIAEQPALTGANIWVAAATGDVEAVRRFLAADASLAGADGGTRHWDPLLYLCFSRLLRVDDARAARMLEIAGLLLDAGADPNSSWIDPQEAAGNRETPLYGAAGVANRVELARLLVAHGANPNDGETAYHMVEHAGVPCADFIVPLLEPLHRGMALGHQLDYDDLPGLRRLLELGADPNGPTPFGNWPLHQAVWRGRDRPFFDLLIRHGADLERRNKEGRTAYAMAARVHRKDIMEWLASAGASTALEPADAFIAACAAGDRAAAGRLLEQHPDLRDGFSDRDACEICEAAAVGNVAGIATMIDMGWDVNAKGVVWGETPAHRAAFEGHVASLALLVERGADLTLTDRSYHGTPLGWAQHNGCAEVIAYLRGLPDRLDLWDAIELGLVDRALALIEVADPNAALRGASAGVLLRLASAQCSRTLVEALLARGADATLASKEGSRAIDVARERGHGEIVRLLESRS